METCPTGKKSKAGLVLSRIEDLPDGALGEIFSQLTFRDWRNARHASPILFRYWKNIILDVPKLLGGSSDFLHDRQMLEEQTIKYVKRATLFMEEDKAAKIESLMVTLYNHDHRSDHAAIDGWIRRAIEKTVTQISIVSHPSLSRFYLPLPENRYQFPCQLFCHQDVCLNSLYLRGCDLKPPATFTGFKHLKFLRLHGVFAHLGFMKALFRDTRGLRELELFRCELPSPLVIVGTNSLSRLIIVDCIHRRGVNITAPSLVTFEYRNLASLKDTAFSICAPQLESFFFFTSEKEKVNPIPGLFSEFSSVSRQLQQLQLHLYCKGMREMPGQLAQLLNLKQLELTSIMFSALKYSDLKWLVILLKACPVLEKLTWRRDRCPHGQSVLPIANWRPEEEFTHSRLEVVEIAACVGNWYEIDFARYLLQCVPGLRTVIFNPSIRYYYGAGQFVEGEPCTTSISVRGQAYWIESGKEIVRRELHEVAGAKLELL